MTLKRESAREVELDDGKLVKTGPGKFEAASEDMRIRGIEITKDWIKVSKIRTYTGSSRDGFGVYVEVEPRELAGRAPRDLLKMIGIDVAVVKFSITFDPKDLKVVEVATSKDKNSFLLKTKDSITVRDEFEIDGKKKQTTFEVDFAAERKDVKKLLAKKALKDEYKDVIGHEPPLHFWQSRHL
jgi:hypothetical protein